MQSISDSETPTQSGFDCVKEVLQQDAAARACTPDTSKLWALVDIRRDQEWDYTLPTITTRAQMRNQLGTPVCFNTDAAFATEFYTKHRFLRSVNMNNLLIAGGSVGSILTRTEYGDIDFFVYGTTLDEAGAVAARFVDELAAIVVASNEKRRMPAYGTHDENEIHTLRSSHALTIKIPAIYWEKSTLDRNGNPEYDLDGNITIQLIFRVYTSISEVLHGFDVGGSAVGFDGARLYFTSLGRLAYERRCLVLDTTRRSTTYEKRLQKYIYRGFELVLPNLNMATLRTSYFRFGMSELCDLPFMPFSYRSISGNKIVVEQFFPAQTIRSDGTTCRLNADESDYGPNESTFDESEMEYRLIYSNAAFLIRDQTDRMLCYSTKLSSEILTSSPFITRRKMEWFYDQVAARAIRNNAISLNLLKRYVVIEPIESILHNVADKGIQYVKDVIARQRLVAYDAVAKMASEGVQWKTLDPGTQLTGSFNPIIEDTSLWYGTYYVEDFGAGVSINTHTMTAASDDTDNSDKSSQVDDDGDDGEDDK